MARGSRKTTRSNPLNDERLQVPQPDPGQPANGENLTTEAALDVWLELLIDFIVNAVVEEQREAERPSPSGQ